METSYLSIYATVFNQQHTLRSDARGEFIGRPDDQPALSRTPQAALVPFPTRDSTSRMTASTELGCLGLDLLVVCFFSGRVR